MAAAASVYAGPMLLGGLTSLAGGLVNEMFFAGPARRRYNQESRAAIEERRAAEQARIDAQNAKAQGEIQRAYGAQQAVAYRLAHAHKMDAERQAANYSLVAQDYINASGAKAAQQVVSYTRSGALVAGSALLRVQQTKEEGDTAAERLRTAAEHAKKRGKRISDVVRTSVIKRPYVPIMDAIAQPFVPQQSNFSPVGSFFGGMMGGAQNLISEGISGLFNKPAATPLPFGTSYGSGGNPYMQAFQSGGVYNPPSSTVPFGVTTGAFNFSNSGFGY